MYNRSAIRGGGAQLVVHRGSRVLGAAWISLGKVFHHQFSGLALQ